MQNDRRENMFDGIAFFIPFLLGLYLIDDIPRANYFASWFMGFLSLGFVWTLHEFRSKK